MDGSAPVPINVLSDCFFVIDEFGDKDTPMKDKLLFFSPENFKDNAKRTLLAESVRNLANFMKAFQFSSEPISTLSLMNVKFAIIQEGQFTLAVSATTEEADSTLREHIQTLYDAFRFFWGPIEDTNNRFKDRQSFIKCISEQCRVLIPLLERFSYQRKLNPFQWLPFAHQVPNTSRYFMQASNILSSIQVEETVFGACMFYDNSVFCTHLSTKITKWCLNVVESFHRQKKTDFESTTTKSEFFAAVPVYLTMEECKRIRLEQSAKDKGKEKNVLRTFMHDVHNNNGYNDTEKGRYVILCIIFSKDNHISLALLVDKQTTNRSFRRMCIRRDLHSRLVILERKIVETMQEGNITTEPYDYSGTLPFHYLVTDSLTGMTRGTTIHSLGDEPTREHEYDFLTATSYVHEAFYENNKISKVLLSGSRGMFYGRHMFTKEAFYQRSTNEAHNQANFKELEEIAQEDLRFCLVDII